MSASLIVAAFGVGLAFVGILSATVANLKSTAVKADQERLEHSNENLRKDNQDERDRRNGLEDRLHDLERDYALLKDSDTRKSAALARIGEAAASGAELRELAELMRLHDQEAATRHAATIKALRDVRNAVTARAEHRE